MTPDAPKPFKAVSEEELAQIIESIGPRSEVYVGKRFLQKLQAERGVIGVVKAVAHYGKILDDQTEVTYSDLTSDDERLLRSILPDMLSRRGFGIGMLSFAGAAFTTLGGLSLAYKTQQQLDSSLADQTPLRRKTSIGRTLDGLNDHLIPEMAELAIGGYILFYDVPEIVTRSKLEQFANAIGEIAEVKQAMNRQARRAHREVQQQR